MIRTIIIDSHLENIQKLLLNMNACCKDVVVVDSCLAIKEGLLSARKHHPDLVMIPFKMPWMTGLEMLQILQQFLFVQAIIMLDEGMNVEEMPEQTGVYYLTTPVKQPILEKTISLINRNLILKFISS